MNPLMITPRKAQQHDFDSIMTVILHARAAIGRLGIDQWQDGYPEGNVIEEDIRLQRGWVFEDEGRIAAYVVMIADKEPAYDDIEGQWITEGDNYLTIHRMAIDDAWRGKGLSTQMIAFAEEYARQQNLISVRADTHRGNVAMRGLMNKCGFELCGQVAYLVRAGDPYRVAYEKVLK